MSRDNWAKWVLPDEVHPATSTSWCVPVPDDPFYRAAFLGALAALGSAYKWQDDPDHKAKEVAQVWRDIADNLQKCMPDPKPPIFMSEESEIEMALICDIRIHNGNLQVKNGCDCDGNSIWADVCSDGSTLGSDGTVQPSEGARPDPGDSECVTRQMSGKDSYLIPFGVQNGDTITVSNRTGAWSNDGISWTCTDGTPFVLGSCVGSRYHVAGDPDATLFHGQLALLIAGSYYSLTDGALVLSGLPSGLQQATVVPNFEVGNASAGNISFKLCVENGATPPVGTWCKVFDFRGSDYDFIPDGHTEWVPGVGFRSLEFADCHVTMDLTTVIQLTHATMVMPIFESVTQNICAIADTAGNDWCTMPSTEAATVDFDFTGCAPETGVQFYFQASDAGTAVVSQLTLTGIGTNPFGTNNC